MERRLKILRVQHSLVEASNHRLLDELARFGELQVRAVCPRWGVESGSRRVLRSERPDITVAKTIFTFNYSTKIYLTGLLSLIRNWRPDVIDLHEEPWSLAAGETLALRRAFAPDARILAYSAQNIHKVYPPVFAQIQESVIRAAAAFYVCSGGVLEVIAGRGFGGRIDVVPLGLDPEAFEYRRHAGSIGARGLTAGFVGRVAREKGVLTLVRAAALAGPRVRVVFVGPGPDVARARALARKLDVEDRVEFTGGIPHERVAARMRDFDVLVVPSLTTHRWKEQFGRVITEAMSLGVPVIGSDSGSIPEVIGDAGLIFPEDDEKRLAALLLRLLDDPKQLAEMSVLGRDRVMRRYTWARVAEMMRELYHYVGEKTG